MKTPRNINSTVVFIIFCLIITFLLSVILTTITSFNEYNVLSKALGASYEYNPKSTESILKSLKNSSDIVWYNFNNGYSCIYNQT